MGVIVYILIQTTNANEVLWMDCTHVQIGKIYWYTQCNFRIYKHRLLWQIELGLKYIFIIFLLRRTSLKKTKKLKWVGDVKLKTYKRPRRQLPPLCPCKTSCYFWTWCLRISRLQQAFPVYSAPRKELFPPLWDAAVLPLPRSLSFHGK